MFYRFTLDLAIPEAIFGSISTAKKQAFRDAVRGIKTYATKINNGSANEEMTIKATWHKCHNDTLSQLCEPEQEI